MTDLTTQQKKILHHCPTCSHLSASHDGAGCNVYRDDWEPCGCEWQPRFVTTTYESIEALVSSVHAAANAEQERLRVGIEALAEFARQGRLVCLADLEVVLSDGAWSE